MKGLNKEKYIIIDSTSAGSVNQIYFEDYDDLVKTMSLEEMDCYIENSAKIGTVVENVKLLSGIDYKISFNVVGSQIKLGTYDLTILAPYNDVNIKKLKQIDSNKKKIEKLKSSNFRLLQEANSECFYKGTK